MSIRSSCFIVSAALASAALLAGCESKPTPSNAGASSTAQKPDAAPASAPVTTDSADAAALQRMLRKQTPTPAGTGELPPGHPPIDTGGGAAPPAAASGGSGATGPGGLPSSHPPVPGVTTDLKFDVPTEWKPTAVRSTMRKAQFVLPRAEGDSEDGEMILFYFGRTEGGSVADNLARWRDMFKTADGNKVGDDAVKSETFEVNGLKVTMLEVTGRYAPSAMPGAAPQEPRDNYRMLAAVVETPNGPWFFRGTGPVATMAAHAENLRKLLNSVRM